MPDQAQPTVVKGQDPLDRLDSFVNLTYLMDQGRAYRNVGQLHCPKCGDARRMDVTVLLKRSGSSLDAPMLVTMTCSAVRHFVHGSGLCRPRREELGCASVDLWRPHDASHSCGRRLLLGPSAEITVGRRKFRGCRYVPCSS